MLWNHPNLIIYDQKNISSVSVCTYNLLYYMFQHSVEQIKLYFLRTSKNVTLEFIHNISLSAGVASPLGGILHTLMRVIASTWSVHHLMHLLLSY